MARKTIYVFGSFCLDPQERRLLRNGEAVDLTPKAFNTLLILIQKAGHLLTKQELMSIVWPDSHVAETNLTVTIAMLRKALGEEAAKQYIETVSRQGYRFVASVKLVTEDEKTQSAASPSAFKGKLTVAAVLVIALTIGVYYVVRFYKGRETSGTVPGSLHGRVAVLEFKSLSQNPQDAWLSTAFSEWLTNELQAGADASIVSSEKVAYMATDLSLKPNDIYPLETLARIRKHLNADTLVVGSFAASGEQNDSRIRVDVRIVNAATGETLASRTETGNRAGLLDLVSNLGSMLRDELRLNHLSSIQATEAKGLVPKDSSTARLYAEAMEKLHHFDPQGARQLLEETTRAEPDYPLAHAALATAWSALGYETKARDEADKATRLASGLPREQSLRIEATYRTLDKDWQRALQLYSTLCTLDPNNFEYGIELARVQISAGKTSEALSTLQKLRGSSHSDDPSIDLAEASADEALGDFPAEQAAADRALTKGKERGIQRVVVQALLMKGWALDNMGKIDEAIIIDQEARQVAGAMGDRFNVGFALKNIGDALDDEGKLADSVATYEQAVQIFQEIGSQSGIAISLNNMAFALKDQGKLSEAKDTFAEAIRICQKTGDTKREALSLNGIASIFWREDDLVAALNMYERALAEHKANGNKSNAATVLGNIALVLEDKGEFSKARDKFEESLSLYRQTGSTPQVARTRMNIGELLYRQGDLKAAQTQFEEALKIGRETRNNSIVGYALLDLGEVAAERGDLTEAMKRNEDALALRLQMGEMGTVAESRFYIADLEVEQGLFTAAAAHARQAAEQFEKEGENAQKACSFAILSEALFRQGKQEESQKAIELALQISEKIEDRQMRMFIARKTAAVSSGSSMFTESVKRVSKAIAESKKYHYLGHELELRLALGKLELREGRTNEGRTVLSTLEKEATSKGFLLISRKATEALKQQLPARAEAQ